MNKYEITLTMNDFDGRLVATVNAESRAHAQAIAERMANSCAVTLDIAHIGMVREGGNIRTL